MRDYEFYYTQDGSIGLYSYADKDVYHSKFGALTEAWEKFVLPSGIETKLEESSNINVLDVCYGIGYNTKALMSFVLNKKENYLKKEKIFSKIKKQKSSNGNNSIETIDNDNNIHEKKEILSIDNETIYANNAIVNIDCLDINEELIKYSPLLKTVVTPQEIFEKIIPKFFNCLDIYWKIKKFLKKYALKISKRNKKIITDLLNLKFDNEYEEVENEYKIHKYVSYILVDSLINKYNDNYITKRMLKKIRKNKIMRFFDKSILHYAKFKQNCWMNSITKLNLFTFLHNIYYEYITKRYNNLDYLAAKALFNINFYAKDARETILTLDKQYDYIFLDAFTFSKAPELWTVEFMQELYKRLSPTGILLTYSNSALVRNTFIENNFYIGKIYNPKTNKIVGTVATKEKSLIKHPLNNQELGLCATKAGITYHDPTLSRTKEQILKQREYDFKTSDLLTSSQYMKLRSQKENENEEDIEE